VREKCAKGAQPTLVGTPSIDWTRRDMLRYKQFASTSFRMLVGYSFPLWKSVISALTRAPAKDSQVSSGFHSFLI